jgi:nucleoside-diphosphate-sugar epimerase
MQTVLVAGGAGFIGSHLSKQLLQDGYSVLCIDNVLTGSKKNIEELLPNTNFHFLESDITGDIESVLSDIPKIDFVFHLASPASPNKQSKNSYINKPLETLLANSKGTHTLLELTKKHNAAFLFASTSEVYGDPTVSPQSESYWGNVNPNGVRSVYDEAKRFGEAMSMAYVRTYEVDARIVRIFNTYGPHMQPDDGRVVSNFIVEALVNKPITIYGDGTQTRSFCYVSDMVEGISKAMFLPQTKGSVINLGNPNERTIAELATMIKDLIGSTSEVIYEALPEDDPKIRKPDITLAKQVLGWEPKVTIQDGLEKTIEYFKKSL